MRNKGKPATGNYIPSNPSKYDGAWPIVYRSSWELKVMKYFDANPNVVKWNSESIIVGYHKPIKFDKDKIIQTRPARYFPDFFAIIRDSNGKLNKYLIEVKPYVQTLPPLRKRGKRKQTLLKEMYTYAVNRAKWEYAEEYCKKRGWEFKILTEMEIYNKKKRPKLAANQSEAAVGVKDSGGAKRAQKARAVIGTPAAI